MSSSTLQSPNKPRCKTKIRALDPSITRIREFTTLDNGGAAYNVKINRSKREVKIRFAETADEYVKFDDVGVVWLGCGAANDVNDKTYKHYIANTALVVSGNTAAVIGGCGVYSFELLPGEKVIKYYSTVGNSATPYGYTETNRRVIGVESNNCDNIYILKTSDVDYSCMPIDKTVGSKPLETKIIMQRNDKSTESDTGPQDLVYRDIRIQSAKRSLQGAMGMLGLDYPKSTELIKNAISGLHV